MKLLENAFKDFRDGLKASISSKNRIFATSSVSLLVFVLTVLSGSPEYSYQMLTAGLNYWPAALSTRLIGLISTSGYIGLFFTALFSTLVGTTMTNTLIQFKRSKISTDMIGSLPGFLAGGCASCGVGVLSILGLGGVISSLPFQGNLLRFGGIVILVALIVRTGNPETCKI